MSEKHSWIFMDTIGKYINSSYYTDKIMEREGI